MLLEIGRGQVRLRLEERTVKINGEMLVPSPGMADFLIYRESIQCWEPPFDVEPIDDATKPLVLDEVRKDLEKLGRIVEIV